MNCHKIGVAEPSVADLRQKVIEALHQTGYPHHRTLEVRVDQHNVLVEGRLPTWHLRQVAIECIRGVPGVTTVVDRILVVAALHDGL